MFLIAILAETNRPPFDLPEAESELVAGFMTEHGASIFVFFFLGEYSALILMSAFMSVFFLGGHHCPDLHKLIFDPFVHTIIYFQPAEVPISFSDFVDTYLKYSYSLSYDELSGPDIIFNGPNTLLSNIYEFRGKETIIDSLSLLIDKLHGSYILGLKIITVVFFFI